ncbi:hypothetical protein ABIF68_001761 [Bradyrhizobium japonicum]
MQDVPAPYGGESPLFSIIIPLEHHRGQWELSWLGWTSQTADKSLYEIILVVPPDFKALNELKALAGGKARLEFTNSDHDIGLCAFGATKARGKYLFFTESHCRPEPDVMEACIRAIDARPDWAGFSCQSVPICHNRLSVAEAAMYQADIEFGMKQSLAQGAGPVLRDAARRLLGMRRPARGARPFRRMGARRRVSREGPYDRLSRGGALPSLLYRRNRRAEDIHARFRARRDPLSQRSTR